MVYASKPSSSIASAQDKMKAATRVAFGVAFAAARLLTFRVPASNCSWVSVQPLDDAIARPMQWRSPGVPAALSFA